MEAPKEEKVEGGNPEIEPGSEVEENGEWEEIKDEDTLSISAQSNSGNTPEQGEREEKIEEKRDQESQSSSDEEMEGQWERQDGLKLKLKRTHIDLTDESEEEEVIIRLKKPKLGVRRIVKVEVHSNFYLEGYGERRLVRSSVDTSYPQDYE